MPDENELAHGAINVITKHFNELINDSSNQQSEISVRDAPLVQ